MNGVRVIHKRRGKLYGEGEKLKRAYLLIDGKVYLTKKDDDGQKVSLPSVKNYQFLGIQALWNSNITTHSAKVISTSKFLSIPFSIFSGLVHSQPELRLKILNQMIQQLDLLEAKTHF